MQSNNGNNNTASPQIQIDQEALRQFLLTHGMSFVAASANRHRAPVAQNMMSQLQEVASSGGQSSLGSPNFGNTPMHLSRADNTLDSNSLLRSSASTSTAAATTTTTTTAGPGGSKSRKTDENAAGLSSVVPCVLDKGGDGVLDTGEADTTSNPETPTSAHDILSLLGRFHQQEQSSRGIGTTTPAVATNQSIHPRSSQPWEFAGGTVRASHSSTLPTQQQSYGDSRTSSSMPYAPTAPQFNIGAQQQEQTPPPDQVPLQQGGAVEQIQQLLASVSRSYKRQPEQQQPPQHQEVLNGHRHTTTLSQLILNAASTAGGLAGSVTTPRRFEETEENVTIVPCRARGMPRDHNIQTAYFVIREDIKHGDGLHCSHPQCRSRGIRFVYCQVCGVPVAKINFTTRHNHQDVKYASLSKQKSRGDDTAAGAGIMMAEEDDDDYSTSSTSKRKRPRIAAMGEEGQHVEDHDDRLNMISSLLDQRPSETTDFTAMKEWLVTVILATEPGSGGTRYSNANTSNTATELSDDYAKYVQVLANDSLVQALRKRKSEGGQGVLADEQTAVGGFGRSSFEEEEEGGEEET